MTKAMWIGLPLLALAVGAGAYVYAGNNGAACPAGMDKAHVSEVKLTKAEGSLKDRLGCCDEEGATTTEVKLASADKTEAAACPMTGATETSVKMVKADAVHGDDCCAVEETQIADENTPESEDILAQAD